MKTLNKWWSRTNGIKYMGPFKTQERAWASVMGLDGTPAEGACVWFGPEPKESPALLRDLLHIGPAGQES